MRTSWTLLLVCLAGEVFGQTQPAIEGGWEGKLAGRLRVLFTFEGEAGQLAATFQSPDQASVTLRADAASFDGNTRMVTVRMDRIGAEFRGELQGTEISGEFVQGGAKIPLTLRRSGAVAAFKYSRQTRGRVAMEPCRAGDVEGLCATYLVFENREKKSGRRIGLYVMLLPAVADKPEPDAVFGLAGGPGESATAAFPFAIYITELRRYRDIVLVDQRGTGKSNPLPCAYDKNDAQALISNPLTVLNLGRCRVDLESRADLTQYTTSIFADDINEIREALGYKHVNLLGGSYGTLAAQVYMKRHGETVRSAVLKGVTTIDYRIPLAFPKTIQNSLDQLFRRCALDESCSRDFPKLKEEFGEIVRRLSTKPARFSFLNQNGQAQEIVLDRDDFVGGLRAMLYVPSLVSQLPFILHRSWEGDYSLYTKVAVQLRTTIGGEIMRGLSLSVDCAESVPFISEKDIAEATVATYMGDGELRKYQASCRQWPRGQVPKNFLEPLRSAAPVLLIAGAMDPATPPSFAEKVAKGLPRATVVAIPNGTHLTASSCIDRMMTQFVVQASMQGIDTECAKQIRNPPFVTIEQAEKALGKR